MVYAIFFLVFIILAPLTAHLSQWKPASLFAITAIIYAIFGGINLLNAHIILTNTQDTKFGYAETYYVVNRGHVFLNLGFVMLFFAALTWLQSYFGAMRYPRITNALFWLFHIGLLGATSFSTVVSSFFPRPRRYIDYPEFMEAIVFVSSWASLASSTAAISLLGLLIWSVALTWWGHKNR